MPAFVTVVSGPVKLFLSEHAGDARPNTLVYLQVNEVDQLAAEFQVDIEQAPWAREIALTDLDGYRLRIGAPLK